VGVVVNSVITAAKSNPNERQWICSRFVETHAIPPELAMRAKRCIFDSQKRKSIMKQMQQEEELLASFPADLQRSFYWHARLPIIFNSSAMRSVYATSARIIRSLCHNVVSDVLALKNEIVFATGDTCSRMLFVNSGSLNYQYEGLKKQSGSLQQSQTEGNFWDAYIIAKEMQTEWSLAKGDNLCEGVLWTNKWVNHGELTAHFDSVMLAVDAEAFRDTICNRRDATALGVILARNFADFLKQPNTLVSDLLSTEVIPKDRAENDTSDMIPTKAHLCFLSHYKVEAGTEATLMHEALERMVREDYNNVAAHYVAPVFLDSANLKDLGELLEHVTSSHCLVVLLTPHLFQRPWCLAEIVTACRSNTPIVPVEIQRPGMKFEYPNEMFYRSLRNGSFLDVNSVALLQNQGMPMNDVETALRSVFNFIALPFSPHKSANIREAELANILERCNESVAEAAEIAAGKRVSTNVSANKSALARASSHSQN